MQEVISVSVDWITLNVRPACDAPLSCLHRLLPCRYIGPVCGSPEGHPCQRIPTQGEACQE